MAMVQKNKPGSNDSPPPSTTTSTTAVNAGDNGAWNCKDNKRVNPEM